MLLSRRRLAVLSALFALPVLFLIGTGFYYLWISGLFFYAWWPMAGCVGVAYLLAWYWQRDSRRKAHAEPGPIHWTDRDQLAWQKVLDRVQAIKPADVNRFTDADYFAQTGQAMAMEIAPLYHPGKSDPLAQLTIPEILAVVELAAHDLSHTVRTYLPGSHLLTIDRMRQADSMVKWYKRAVDASWAVSALFNPLQTAARFAASKAGVSRPLQLLQNNALTWVEGEFIRRTGYYLVELFSGRLRVGVAKYRELQRQSAGLSPETTTPAETPLIAPVRLAVIGQVKAGKSSLVNALLGERKAATDVLPCTAGITTYLLPGDTKRAPLELYDTVGYEHQGPDADQKDATIRAACDADVLLLVCQARNAARAADVTALSELRAWFRVHPERKMPPVLLVLSQADQLTPAPEWEPPYDRMTPKRRKEQSMADAVTAAREAFVEGLADVAVVGMREDKVFGIEEELLPRIASRLDEGRAVALLRNLYAAADDRKWTRMADQFKALGLAMWDRVKQG